MRSSSFPMRVRASVRPQICTACLLLLGLVGLAPVSAQVQYFERPPTAEEIRAALTKPQPMRRVDSVPMADAPEAGAKTRGIEFIGAMVAPTALAEGKAPMAAAPGPAIALPVAFDAASARVSPSSFVFIEAIVSVLVRDPTLNLIVEGHTDAKGSARQNMMLSWDRAFAVFRLMVDRYGIDPARLQPIGKGSTEPVIGREPLDGKNRRVQFRVAG